MSLVMSPRALLVGVLNVRWNDRGKPVMIAMLRALLLASMRKKRLGSRVLRMLKMHR